MSTSRTKALFYMLVLFVAGGICGAMVMRHFFPPPQPQTLQLGRTNEIAGKIRTKLHDRLQLNADQMAKAEPLVQTASQKLEDAHLNCLIQIEAAIAQLHHDLRLSLTDAQISELAVMEKERADSLLQKYNFCPTMTNATGH